MIKALIVIGTALGFTATSAFSQTQIGVRPASSGMTPSKTSALNAEAARPLLGYMTDSSNVIYSVVGSSASPSWGVPLSLPDSTAVAFLPPRQEYALLSTGAGLSVARLSRSVLLPGSTIANAMARPDRVAFSPSGEAAALFSPMESRIDVVRLAGGQGKLSWSVPVTNTGGLERLAISDDGELLIATFAGQGLASSLHGTAWKTRATGYSPDSLTFLPGAHELVLSDWSRKEIVLLSQAEHEPLVPRVLASGGSGANLLSVNKQGNRLLAAAMGTSSLWSIDLVSGVVAYLPEKGSIDSLSVLRDGQTFLVSIKESPVVVRLTSDAAQTASQNNSR